ncbi:MAG: helix-turn-helix transcriptional regulator [Clostridia bacterium]|nr:helix-turn-helix transcriptional regulator [Clostridia bacterium]
MTFGDTFRAYRKRMGYTQEEVAEKLLVTPQAVSKWETGGGTPDISLLIPIADAFGITTDALLGNSRKTIEELSEEIKTIDSEWNSNDAEQNFGEKYQKYYELLKSNPDSPTVLRSVLQLSCKWLSACSVEMNISKKRELVENAEKCAEILKRNPADTHSTHCLMYEIYYYGDESKKAELEMEHFSATGQYIKDRVKYVHLRKENRNNEALPHLSSSLTHTFHWLLWDLRNLSDTYRALGDDKLMKQVTQVETILKDIKQQILP